MTESMRLATLTFLLRGDDILLAEKKEGFGLGKWNGVGGKVELGETVEKAAIREAFEEIDVEIKDQIQVATIDFYFKDNPEYDQQVIVFTSDKWVGEPKEIEKVRPKWVSKNEIPYDKMWVDDKYWLPQVLEGKRINAWFEFDKDENILDYGVEELK